MKIIGITGSSGSGKSTVARIIADELNAKLIVADEVVKQMQEPETLYYKEIVNIFGKEYLGKDNKLNRKKIAKCIFEDNEKRVKLNSLTQKYVADEIKHQITNSNEEYIVIDVPLLIESGLSKICNIVIASLSNKNIQIERICKRDSITKQEAIARLKVQPNNEFYQEHADYIIINEGEKNDKLMGRIREILQELQ